MTYELELERNGGDWRIRRDPAQKGLNGKPPSKDELPSAAASVAVGDAHQQDSETGPPQEQHTSDATILEVSSAPISSVEDTKADADQSDIELQLQDLKFDSPPTAEPVCQEENAAGGPAEEESDEDDGEGWITPSNLKQQQAKDASATGPKEASIQGTLQAALLTSDFAMQNVALRINLKCVVTVGNHFHFPAPAQSC